MINDLCPCVGRKPKYYSVAIVIDEKVDKKL